MEVCAAYGEHADVQAGRIVDEIDCARVRRQHADLLHLGRQRHLGPGPGRHHQRAGRPQRHRPTTIEQQLQALEELGGLDVLGGPKSDPIYHSGFAWALEHPVQGHHDPGWLLRRHPQPDGDPVAWWWITADPTPRPQFHHSNDVVPTIYEILGITPPLVVNGVRQDSLDGVSFAYAFGDPNAEGLLDTPYFEILGCRGIYHKGWMASTFGPRVPWVRGLPPGIHDWTPDKDALGSCATWKTTGARPADLAAEMGRFSSPD